MREVLIARNSAYSETGIGVDEFESDEGGAKIDSTVDLDKFLKFVMRQVIRYAIDANTSMHC